MTMHKIWKNRPYAPALAALIVSTLLLCACQKAPDAPAVVSKNDGAFEAALDESATQKLNGTPSEAITEGVPDASAPAAGFDYTEEFNSADGKTQFTISAHGTSSISTSAPVIRVTPHPITPTEAHKVATALFGDVKMYEYNTVLTKAEIEEKIIQWRRALSDESIESAVGSNEEDIENARALRQRILDDYVAQYEAAPDTAEKVPCQWTYYPQSHYSYRQVPDSDTGTNRIQASFELNNMPYLFWVTNRNETDYRVQMISAFVDESTAGSAKVDRLYGSACPTVEQIAAVKAAAQEMLDSMDMGEWVVVDCKAQKRTSSDSAYEVFVQAAPVYEGIPVTVQKQFSTLKSEDIYASNYYYEEINMLFTCDCRLTYFRFYAPLDVVETKAAVPVFTFEEALQSAREKLMLANVDSDIFSQYDRAFLPHIAKAIVNIDEVVFGLSRICIKDAPEDFYLVPSVTLRGSCTAYDDQNSLVPSESDLFGTDKRTETYLVLNLVDGSVIDVSRGY